MPMLHEENSYGNYSRYMKIDPFGENPPYVRDHIRIHQDINHITLAWKPCEISNTGFGSLTSERAAAFALAYQQAVEVARRWDAELAGKNAQDHPLPHRESDATQGRAG